MHLNFDDKLVIGYFVFCLFLHIALWRKKLSKPFRRRALMGTLASVPASVILLSRHHPHSLTEPVVLSICGAMALIFVWGFTCMIKEGDIEKQKRLDAGIVLKEDRVYNDWAKPDPE
ncbi:MAG: hypothetical protein JWQ02_2350 [Capsulimonas sp.]|jgi:hypothetical protein|nr:hypothetical protein [Capsulimonas sp.]